MRMQYGLLCVAAAMVVGFGTTVKAAGGRRLPNQPPVGSYSNCGCVGTQNCCSMAIYHGIRRVCWSDSACYRLANVNKLHAPAPNWLRRDKIGRRIAH